MQKNKTYNIKETTEKIQSFCALQDRCQWEVQNKMRQWGVEEYLIENIVTDLILEKFIDEQRFSESFCRGKFRIKRWGKVKIKNELRLRKISVSCIEKGLEQIEDEEYYSILKELYEKKNSSLKEQNLFIRNKKIVKYLQQKGFESNLIWELINRHK